MADKTDLRVIKTRENIKKSFTNLLLAKDFKDITVQNIIDEALIGRSTFYAHFYDKYDLLEQMASEMKNEFTILIRDRFNLYSHDEFINFFSKIIEYYSKQRLQFLALLRVHTETVDLYSSLLDILNNQCLLFLDSLKVDNKLKVPKEYFSRLYAAAVMASIQWCLENGEEYTPETFVELFNSLKILIAELF